MQHAKVRSPAARQRLDVMSPQLSLGDENTGGGNIVFFSVDVYRVTWVSSQKPTAAAK